jgi:hypothetical protein
MSRQSKNASNQARAAEFTALHKQGLKGPKQTTPKHGKKNTRWNHPETAKARAAILKKFHDNQEEKTVLEKMNEKKEKVRLHHSRDSANDTQVEAIETAELDSE